MLPLTAKASTCSTFLRPESHSSTLKGCYNGTRKLNRNTNLTAEGLARPQMTPEIIPKMVAAAETAVSDALAALEPGFELSHARELGYAALGRVLINRPRPIFSNDVRYCTNSGIKADINLGPLCAKSGQDVYPFCFANGLATSRAWSINTFATGETARFFRVMTPIGRRGIAS